MKRQGYNNYLIDLINKKKENQPIDWEKTGLLASLVYDNQYPQVSYLYDKTIDYLIENEHLIEKYNEYLLMFLPCVRKVFDSIVGSNSLRLRSEDFKELKDKLYLLIDITEYFEYITSMIDLTMESLSLFEHIDYELEFCDMASRNFASKIAKSMSKLTGYDEIIEKIKVAGRDEKINHLLNVGYNCK